MSSISECFSRNLSNLFTSQFYSVYYEVRLLITERNIYNFGFKQHCTLVNYRLVSKLLNICVKFSTDIKPDYFRL